MKKEKFIYSLLLVLFLLVNSDSFSQNRIEYTSINGTTYVKEANTKSFRVHTVGKDLNLLIPELTKSKFQNIEYTNFEGKTFEPFKSENELNSDILFEKEIQLPFIVKDFGNNNYVISTNHKSDEVFVDIFDNLGSKIKSIGKINHDYNLELSNFSIGVYFLNLKIDGVLYTHKLLIK